MASLPEHLRPIPAGRPKLSREVMVKHQKARVVEAAIPIFATKGYPATSVDDLVAAARIGVGSFYSHFSGKEQCLIAAYDRVIGEAREVVIEAVGGAESWQDRVCLGLRALLGWIAAEPVLANVALVQIQTGGSPALARYAETLDSLAAFLRTGRAEFAALQHPPDSLEESTANGIAWLLHQQVSLGEADTIGDLFDDLAGMILEPYLGEGAWDAIAAPGQSGS